MTSRMAEVLAFPLARRRDFVRRQSDIALALAPDAAERHIARQVREQCTVLLRKGVSPEAVAAQGRHLEAALRAEMWGETLTPGGAA